MASKPDFAPPREGQTQIKELALLADERPKLKEQEMPKEHMIKAKLEYFAKMKKDAAI